MLEWSLVNKNTPIYSSTHLQVIYLFRLYPYFTWILIHYLSSHPFHLNPPSYPPIQPSIPYQSIHASTRSTLMDPSIHPLILCATFANVSQVLQWHVFASLFAVYDASISGSHSTCFHLESPLWRMTGFGDCSRLLERSIPKSLTRWRLL